MSSTRPGPTQLSRTAVERFVVDVAAYEHLAARTARAVATPSEPSDRVELLVLFLLDVHGPQRPTALVALTGLTSGGVSKLVDRLERAGVVSRAVAPAGDLRAVGVRITARGSRFVGRVAGAIADALRGTPVLPTLSAAVHA